MVVRQVPVTCPICDLPVEVNDIRNGVNFCRGRVIAAYVETHPSLTAWEIAQGLGLSYHATQRGILKARDGGLLVISRIEDRPGGGQRFRYAVADNWREVEAEWWHK